MSDKNSIFYVEHCKDILSKAPTNAYLYIFVSITILTIIVMLYIGLRFKGANIGNNIEILKNDNGIYFHPYSISYTDRFFKSEQINESYKGISIELKLKITNISNASFSYILSVYSGSNESQLLIGQWKNWIVIMNGDDHDGRKGIKKANIDITSWISESIVLSISSGKNGTYVYANGKLLKKIPSLYLYFPNTDKRARLILGNSVYGKHPWQGIISRLKIYDVALKEKEIKQNIKDERLDRFDANYKERTNARISYKFREKIDGLIRNLTSSQYHLNIPAKMQILNKKILSWPKTNEGTKNSLFKDAIVNFLGFIPLGLIISITINSIGNTYNRWNFLITICIAFTFSFMLEIFQIWIPSRDSSMLDLILNTTGAGFGIIIAKLLKKCCVCRRVVTI